MMASVSDALDLHPGFRFHPTDEEIITHYLSAKVVNPSFTAAAVGEVDLNKCEPWDLPSKAKMVEKDWYFFCQRDRKYPTGTRTNRATESGYWKATGKDKEIFRGNRVLVGMKKTIVFYMGRAPKGQKTNWVMHEFKLEGKLPPFIRSAKDEWVVSKVFNKSMGATTNTSSIANKNSYGEELSPLKDSRLFNSIKPELSSIARMNSYGEEPSPLIDPTLFNSIKPNLSSIVRMNSYVEVLSPLIDPSLFNSIKPNLSSIVRMYSNGEVLSPLMDPTLFNSIRPELSYANNFVDLDYGLPIINNQMGIFDRPPTSGFQPQIQTSTPYFPLPGVPNITCLHQDLS